MASNITKYAKTTCIVYNDARIACSDAVGLKRRPSIPSVVFFPNPDKLAAARIIMVGFVLVPFCPTPSPAAAADGWAKTRFFTSQISYSWASRRKNSSTMTRPHAPRQDAANPPRVVTCQSDEMKHASIVYQFHSIW